MRVLLLLSVVGILAPAGLEAKLSDEQKRTLLRDLTAEYGSAQVLVPRSKKPLEVREDGSFDPQEWGEALREFGPAARLGDMVQITKVDFKGKKVELEINHGIKGGAKWWHRIQMSGGSGMGGRNRGTTLGQANHAPGGTTLAIVFEEEIPDKSAEELLAILKPVLDFDERSASEAYLDQLEPEMREAIEAGEILEGMDRDMTLLAKGRPDNKVREFENGVETEDWIYGKPPGDIVFVTFEDGEVIRVKHAHANLGGQVRKIEPIER